jgi:hypothetical protein
MCKSKAKIFCWSSFTKICIPDYMRVCPFWILKPAFLKYYLRCGAVQNAGGDDARVIRERVSNTPGNFMNEANAASAFKNTPCCPRILFIIFTACFWYNLFERDAWTRCWRCKKKLLGSKSVKYFCFYWAPTGLSAPQSEKDQGAYLAPSFFSNLIHAVQKK